MNLNDIQPQSVRTFALDFIAFAKVNGVTISPAVAKGDAIGIDEFYLDYSGDSGVFRVDVTVGSKEGDSAHEWTVRRLRSFYGMDPDFRIIPWTPYTPSKGYVVINPPVPSTRVGREIAPGFFAINDNSGEGAMAIEDGKAYKVVRFTMQFGEGTGVMAFAWKLLG